MELAPEGTGYRARTRFSKFFNLPELMNLFKEVADIKTADQLNLPTPEVQYHNIVAQPTEHQQEMVKALSERASLVPVSYTHLDVYKRQTLPSPSGVYQSGSHTAPSAAKLPVSEQKPPDTSPL